MIEEAKYWQDDLKKIVGRLETRYRQKRWTVRSLHSVEKEIFLSFFIIRKLIESKRLSKRLVGMNLKLTRYPRISTKPVSTKPEEFHEHYDLTKGEKHQLSLEKFSSQFIHSYIFSPFVPMNIGMVGVFFCSDTHKDHCLYYVTLAKVIEIIASVSVGNLKTVKLAIDPGTSVIRTNIK